MKHPFTRLVPGRYRPADRDPFPEVRKPDHARIGAAEVHVVGEILATPDGGTLIVPVDLAGSPEETLEVIKRAMARHHPGRGYIISREISENVLARKIPDHGGGTFDIRLDRWRPVDAPRELDPQDQA